MVGSPLFFCQLLASRFLLLFLLFLSSCISPLAANNQFLLLTDFHLDQKYDRHGDPAKMCHRESENETPKGEELAPFGERTCDSAPALVDYMVKEAARVLPKPDFIIWTGDTPAHANYTHSEFMETMEIAKAKIEEHFPGILVIPVLGNHDRTPSNDFPDDPKQLDLYKDIFNLWREWIGDEAEETFARGGYYRFQSPLDAALYLVLNTNIYYNINQAIPSFLHPDDPTGQFAFLESQLAQAKQNNSFVHILGHVPPGGYEWDSYGTEWNPEMPKKYNKRFVNLFVEYAPWIRWMLFGHLHTDTFRVLKDSAGNPVQRLFLSPAITPIFQLNNPAFRIFEYNESNWDLEDIKTFYVDLDQLNEQGPVKVRAQLEYSMRKEYGLPSLDAVAMNELLERMHKDDSIFETYIHHNKVMYQQPNSTKPDRLIHLCVIGNMDLDELEKCVDSNMNGAVPSSAFPLLLLLLASSLLPLLLLTSRRCNPLLLL